MGELRGTALKQAHGQVRDALAAIKGFGALLGSRTVSSRSLNSSLPDVEASCSRLITSAQRAVPLLEDAFGHGSAGTLLHTLVSRCQTLSAALHTAKPINAARRIELERVARTLLPDLEGALVSLELLKEAWLSEPVLIDIKSLLAQGITKDANLQDGERTVRVTMMIALAQHEIKVKPKVAALVLASSVGFVSDGGQTPCAVEVASTLNPGFLFRITREHLVGIEIEVAIPHLIDASERCCKTATTACGSELTWWEDPKHALVSWPLN